jgi:hypothetical protein
MRTTGPFLSIPGDAWRRMGASGGDIGKDEVGNSGDNRISQSRRPPSRKLPAVVDIINVTIVLCEFEG